MTKRITEPNNQVLRIMIAFGVLGAGFYGLTQVDFYYIQFSFLVISGLVSYLLVFGFVCVRQLFSTPKRFIKTFLLILVGSQIYGMVASMIMGILAQLLDIQTKANSAQDNPWWFFVFILPIALLGEELFSITIFDTLRKKMGINTKVASLLTAIIFGLIHFETYLGSSALFTIVQVILVQGGIRLWFNQAYLKTKSLNTSWAVHYAFDLIAFVLGSLLSS